jgi:hypothetical protein
MKNLNKRMQVLTALAAGVVVVGVLVFAIFQPPLNEMFGTSQMQLVPYTSTIAIGQTVALQMPGGVNCNWSNGDQRVSFVNNVKTGTNVTVKGASAGQAQVIAICVGKTAVGLVNVLASTPAPTKGPLSITPLNPKLNTTVFRNSYNVKLTAVNAAASCEWTMSPDPDYYYRISGTQVEIGINHSTWSHNEAIVITATARCGSETATSKISLCNNCAGSIDPSN